MCGITRSQVTWTLVVHASAITRAHWVPCAVLLSSFWSVGDVNQRHPFSLARVCLTLAHCRHRVPVHHPQGRDCQNLNRSTCHSTSSKSCGNKNSSVVCARTSITIVNHPITIDITRLSGRARVYQRVLDTKTRSDPAPAIDPGDTGTSPSSSKSLLAFKRKRIDFVQCCSIFISCKNTPTDCY